VALTGRDLLDEGLQAIPHSVGTRHPADITLENKDGSPPFIPPHFPVTAQEVRHCGEIVAMVVATSLAAAKDGAELVPVDYEPLPAVSHSVTAVEPGSPLARGDANSNISIDAEVGDPAAHQCGFCQGGAHRQIRDLGATHRRCSYGAARRHRHL
jgi:aerobic carbon-monoxide dehydrogenase large subunit